jgi:hypothetical protein
MKKYIFLFAIIFIIAGMVFNVTIAKNDVKLFNPLAEIEVLASEVKVTVLPTVTIICNAGFYGKCHEMDYTFPNFLLLKACCKSNGNTASTCYSWYEINCCEHSLILF